MKSNTKLTRHQRWYQLHLVRPCIVNWEMLAAIGQLVAAIGVIPSLVWLAFQIREQNKERRRAGINILTAQWSELVKSAQESREFAVLFLRRCALLQRS